MGTSRRSVFVSYSHADASWLRRLRTHLAPLERAGVLDLWDDTTIRPGQDWREEIENALAGARVAVLLISADFLASEFVTSVELPRLLAGAEAGGVTVLPVIVSASRFAETPELSRFQAVNDPDHPLDGLTRAARERELVAVSRAVERALATPAGAGDREARDVPRAGTDRTPEAPDPASALRDNDPLVFFPAVTSLPATRQSYDLLLGTTRYSVAHDEALKSWLANSSSDDACEFLTDTVQNCEASGPTWHRARRASQLFSPSMDVPSVRRRIYDIARSIDIEAVRHALVAYGNLGHTLSRRTLETDVLTSDYDVEKGIRFVVDGWLAAYLSATEFSLETSGHDLRECLEWKSTIDPGTVDLHSVSSAHYDDLSTRWLDETCCPAVRGSALNALGERGVTRAVPAIARLLTADAPALRRRAAEALGQIGGIAAAETLHALPGEETGRQQLVCVAHELGDDALDDALRTYGTDGRSWTDIWLTRSIGLARADRHSDVIVRSLGSALPVVRGTSAVAAARLALPVDPEKVVYEAEPGAERAMATAALLVSRPGDYARVERTWRSDLTGSLPHLPARLVEDVFRCVADVSGARPLVDAWRPVAETWGARI